MNRPAVARRSTAASELSEFTRSSYACNVAAPQFFWFRRVRRSPVGLWLVALVVLLGMWLERYIIVITALHRDYLPSSWGMYSGTVWDWATFLGTLGLFTFLLFLFLRFLPMISIFEMRAQLSEAEVKEVDPPAAEEEAPCP